MRASTVSSFSFFIPFRNLFFFPQHFQLSSIVSYTQLFAQNFGDCHPFTLFYFLFSFFMLCFLCVCVCVRFFFCRLWTVARNGRRTSKGNLLCSASCSYFLYFLFILLLWVYRFLHMFFKQFTICILEQIVGSWFVSENILQFYLHSVLKAFKINQEGITPTLYSFFLRIPTKLETIKFL